MPEEEIHKTILEILRRYIHSVPLKIYLFGSRATGSATPRSDYDIALDAGRPVNWSTMAQIRADLEDSNIPVRVDVVDLETCTETFKSVALQGAKAW
jgi:predicted nucleotidyltransferase